MRELFGYSGLPMSEVTDIIARLLLAAVLGAVIGIEREMKRKPAGLRTNMFICFGSAMFTILSGQLVQGSSGDPTRVAAQIIPGIGFIGAGAILRGSGSVTGLTTAATIFVVASVGMAAGGGMYLLAAFATLVILVALAVLGWMETRFSLKPLVMRYEVAGAHADEVIAELNRVLESERRMMQTIQVGRTDGHSRVQFTVEATRAELDTLFHKLRQSSVLTRVESLGAPESE
jgi:putative Mg2+ transporter-C (MgtC) family protein